MNAQHTPGPWKWLGQNLEGPNNQDVIEAKVDCGQWCQGGMPRLEISDADRALIEAAPDLLDLLKRIADAEFGFGGWPEEAEIRAAIAKATGSAT